MNNEHPNFDSSDDFDMHIKSGHRLTSTLLEKHQCACKHRLDDTVERSLWPNLLYQM